MIDLHYSRRLCGFFQTVILLLVSLLLPCIARAQNYDGLVAMLRNPNHSIQMKGKEMLARTIKESLLSMDPEQSTEDTFLFGHFINPTFSDLAIGISVPPGSGHLVVLSKRAGRYVPAGPVIDVPFIEDITSIKLFPGRLNQIALEDYGQGSGTRYWGEDILRWDGTAMRTIWTWIRKALYKNWPPEPGGEIIGYAVRSKIFIKDRANGKTRKIVTSSTDDEGVFSDKERRYWELERITSHRETKVTHEWNEPLYFYVAKSGEVMSPEITVSCSPRVNGIEGSDTLYAGMKVGILEIPGTALSKGQDYDVVVGKEHFCKIPKSAVRLDH